MIRRVLLLFFVFLAVQADSSDGGADAEGLELSSTHNNNPDDKKGEERDEKLDDEEEIETISQSESTVVQETSELKINDAMELNKKLENFTIKVATTEKSIVFEQGGEEARQTSETELTELSERLQEGPKREKSWKKAAKMRNEDATKGSFADTIMAEEEEGGVVVGTEKAKIDEDGDKISWDLIHFLIMLTPVEETEITWWSMVLEAVKCSLRNCPIDKSYWHRPVYLPRITRHRRQDSELDLPSIPTTPKPCGCSNLERYFEQLYESIGKRKSNTTVS